MKKIIFIMLAGSLFALGSCTKTGSQGPAGPAGADGNANVIGSDPFTVADGTWDHSNNIYSATFTDNDLTADVVSNGLVEIYKQYSDGSWTNLPDINGVVSTVYSFDQGGFIISVLTTDGSTTPNPHSVTFRTVIIPSSIRKAHPNTNWKNYNEATAALSSSASVTQ